MLVGAYWVRIHYFDFPYAGIRNAGGTKARAVVLVCANDDRDALKTPIIPYPVTVSTPFVVEQEK
jgi:hypothetical protein